MNVILENITKSYEEGGKRHDILMNLNAEFPAGQLSIILGKSGTGKSTLLNLISGIDIPDSGSVTIAGTNVTGLTDTRRTLFRRKNIGFVFQFFNLIPTLSVLENITLVRELEGMPSKGNTLKARELLSKVNLLDRQDTMPDRLSGGEQQRVAFLRALAHEPDIILADEPTGNLDNETGRQLLTLMHDLIREKGKTFIMATHSEDALAFSDLIFRIKDGELVPA